ncbi:hypothetical protein Tco_0038123 [Tanacetum coccineum]
MQAIIDVAVLFENASIAKDDMIKAYKECKDIPQARLIMEYFVKISKKARILELKRINLKNIILTLNTPNLEYLVNIGKRRAFWSLNDDILKITILTTNTPYPSRRYGVSVPALTKDHKGNKTNTPYQIVQVRYWKK